MDGNLFDSLEAFLLRVPAVKEGFGTGIDEKGLWWIKFKIDILHPLAWQVVQELGHVVNYLSFEEKLPTTFYPASPPPCMNGGPQEFLSWVIENTDANFTPDKMREWLEGRLPRPVSDEAGWLTDEDED